jgi:hypothetical protein
MVFGNSRAEVWSWHEEISFSNEARREKPEAVHTNAVWEAGGEGSEPVTKQVRDWVPVPWTLLIFTSHQDAQLAER